MRLEKLYSASVLREDLEREVLENLDDVNAEVLEEYRQSRRSAARLLESSQQEPNENETGLSSTPFSNTSDMATQGDRLDAMYHVPPPPFGYTSAPSRTSHSRISNWNQCVEAVPSSSNYSLVKRISQSSGSARPPTTSSFTDYSGLLSSDAQSIQAYPTNSVSGMPLSAGITELRGSVSRPGESSIIPYRHNGVRRTFTDFQPTSSGQQRGESSRNPYVPSQQQSQVLTMFPFEFTSPQSYHQMPAFEDPRLQDPRLQDPSTPFPPNAWNPAGTMDNPILTEPQGLDASWALMNTYEENQFEDSPEQESEGRLSKRRQL